MTPPPAPAPTAGPACSTEDRSASGASAFTGSGPFAAATGSPVNRDSSVARPSASTTRASAATTLPASTTSTSPTTRAPTGTASATPPRRTRAWGALRSRSARSARLARTSEVASTALTSTMTEKIAIASRSSPKIADSTPTATSSSCSGSTTDSTISPRTTEVVPRSVRTAAVRRCAISSGLSPPGRLPVRSHTAAGGSACMGTAGARSAVAVGMKHMIRLGWNRAGPSGNMFLVARDWLLITISTPRGGTSTLRVYAWRNLRSLGAYYLQQSVCLLPATPKTTRAATRLVARLRAEGGHGEMLRIHLTDAKQEATVIDAIQRERTDEYREVVERTRQFHEELELERRRGRATYTELEESDADLARHQKWLAAIRARDYFDAPGGQEAAAAVASCEEALARFESEALSAELDEGTPDRRPGLRALKGGSDPT